MGPVIQAIGRPDFEDVTRAGGLLWGFSLRSSVRTRERSLQSEVGDQNPTLLEVRAISLVKQGYIVVLGKAAALVDLA